MIFIDLNILNNILLRNNIKVKLMYVVIQKNSKLKKRLRQKVCYFITTPPRKS